MPRQCCHLRALLRGPDLPGELARCLQPPGAVTGENIGDMYVAVAFAQDYEAVHNDQEHVVLWATLNLCNTSTPACSAPICVAENAPGVSIGDMLRVVLAKYWPAAHKPRSFSATRSKRTVTTTLQNLEGV